TAVEYQAYAVDGERGFRDVGGNYDFAPLIAGHRRVLISGRQFAVQWKNDKFRAKPIGRCLYGARDLIRSRHEDERVALGMLTQQALKLFDRKFPDRRITGRSGQIFDRYRMSAPFR